MIFPGTVSFSTSYAIFTGEIAGVRVLERHDCGAFECFAAIGDQFSADIFFKGCEAIFFDHREAPQKRRIRPHLAPEPRAFGAREPGT